MDPIRHVVLLMLENHSFDQMLGCFNALYPDLEGVDARHTNADATGKRYSQIATRERQMTCDPLHDLASVQAQLANGNGGFIQNFVQRYPAGTDEERQFIMGYYPRGFLPALHTLAEDFLICDHWFASLPGPTWPNRFFALSGTSSGHVEMPGGIMHPDLGNVMRDQNQVTLFDRLDEARRNWAIYYCDIPDSLLLTHQRTPEHVGRYRFIDHFFSAVREESTFPEFAFIEPKYFGLDQNDDHPPHNVMKAEKLISDVYNAIRSNAALWAATLLVIVYDEHGGFYDHVIPPPAVPPDDKTSQYAFNQLGVRVPALLVSPWVRRGFTNTVFDHTSFLKYLTDKWNLGPLGERTAHANSLAPLLQSTPRAENDTVPFLRVSTTQILSPRRALEKEDHSIHHESLHAFAEVLSEDLDEAAAQSLAELGLTLSFWLKTRSALGRFLCGLGERWSAFFDDWRTARQRRSQAIVEKFIAKKKNEMRS